MERYLDGQELDAHEVASALKAAVTNGEVFPVACGVASKNLGTHALLDLLVEGVPSPAKKGSPIEVDGAGTALFVFKTVADPFAGRINLFRVLGGTVTPEATLVNLRSKGKERLGALLELQGKEHKPTGEFVEGDIGAVAKLKDAQTGDLLLDKDVRDRGTRFRFPGARHELRDHAEGEGRRGQGRDRDPPARRGGPDAAAPPRPADGRGDPLRHEPDARRGRARAREAPLRRRDRAPPAARPVSRDDPQGGASPRPLQEADRRPRAVRRLPHRRLAVLGGRVRVRGPDRRRRHPAELPAGGEQGDPGGDAPRRARGRAGAGRPRRARRRLVPHRRLVGDGVQDRRLDGLEGRVPRSRSRCSSSRSWSSR